MRLRGARRGVVTAMTLWAWLVPCSASAQGTREGRVEVSGGVLWAGTTRIATESADEVSFGGQPRALFQSRTDLESSAGFVTRVGIGLTSLLQVEGSVAFNATHLTARLTGDDEVPGGRAWTKHRMDARGRGTGREHHVPDEVHGSPSAHDRLMHERVPRPSGPWGAP